MFCKNCGNELLENVKFCTNCGAPVPLEESVAVEPEIAVEQQNINDEAPLENENCLCDAQNTDAAEESEPVCEEAPGNEHNESAESVLSEDNVVNSNSSAENTPPAKKKCRIGRIIAVVVALFLSFVLFLMLFSASAVQMFRVNIHPNAIGDAFAMIDLEEMTVSELLPEEVLNDMGIDDASDEIVDFIYENIDQEKLEQPLTKENIEHIIGEDGFVDKLFSIISVNLLDIAEGKSVAIITADEICDLVYEEKDFICDVVGYTITEEHITDLNGYLEANYSEIFTEITLEETVDDYEFQNPIPVLLDSVSLLFYVSLIVIVLIIALMCLILRSVARGLKYSGVSAIICGALEVGAASAGLAVFNSLIADSIFIEIAFFKNIISTFVNNVLISLVWIGGTILLLGIVFVVVSVIINIIKKRKARRTA